MGGESLRLKPFREGLQEVATMQGLLGATRLERFQRCSWVYSTVRKELNGIKISRDVQLSSISSFVPRVSDLIHGDQIDENARDTGK